MSYVIAAYAIVLASLATYAWRLGARAREASLPSRARLEAQDAATKTISPEGDSPSPRK
jgi:hypothetical protein